MDTIDQLKPSSNDQTEMMMMMMQLPEFSGAYANDAVAGFPPPDFYGTTNSVGNSSINSTMPLADLNDNPPTPMPWSSFTFTHLPSTTISFANNNLTYTPMLQEQEQTRMALLSNPANENWRTTTTVELSSVNAYGTAASDKRGSMAAMREMIFRIAAMQPIHIDPESVKPPKRRNVKISKDPQSVAARHRRERISERIRILQRLVPGGTKMDTASMLDEAIHYVKFLKTQVQSLERAAAANNRGTGFPVPMSSGTNSTRPAPTPYLPQPQNVEHFGDA